MMQNSRFKLKVSTNFAWLPNGPILQYFMTRAQHEYFRSRFDGPSEMIMVVNAMLSPASSAQFVAKLRKLANEFSEMHNDDKHLPIGARRPASVVRRSDHGSWTISTSCGANGSLKLPE